MPEKMENLNQETIEKIMLAERQAGEVEKIINEKSAKERIRDYVRHCDQEEKALTGRTPEIIEEETGFKKEDIFPEGKQILYVGDPWQRMGREINDSRLKIIDYEFGETASFVEDEEKFRKDIIYEGENLFSHIEYIKDLIKNKQDYSEKEQDIKELEVLHDLVSKAWEMSKSEDLDFYENFYNDDDYGGEEREEKKKKLDEEYKKIAEAWKDARIFIEKSIIKIKH